MREDEHDKTDTCFLCDKPAAYTVNIGDELGPVLRRVCVACYDPE